MLKPWPISDPAGGKYIPEAERRGFFRFLKRTDLIHAMNLIRRRLKFLVMTFNVHLHIQMGVSFFMDHVQPSCAK
jgi:hypothetical protein